MQSLYRTRHRHTKKIFRNAYFSPLAQEMQGGAKKNAGGDEELQEAEV